jgi:predicted nucleotidyltransferase
MNKEEIKIKIKEAIECNPLRDDIQKVSLFGSYINSMPRQDSDIDLLIEFKPTAKIGLFELVRLQRRLGEFIGKKVDLLTPQSLSRFFREEVLAEAENIYEG